MDDGQSSHEWHDRIRAVRGRRRALTVLALVMTAILGAVLESAQGAHAYTILTSASGTVSSYTGNTSSTLTAYQPSQLKGTMSIVGTNSTTSALLSAYAAANQNSYNTGALATTVSSTWPMVYFPLVPRSGLLTTSAAGKTYLSGLESFFGMTKAGWSQFKDVGTVRLAFSRPLANPVITVGGPGVFCGAGTLASGVGNIACPNGGAVQEFVTFNPKYTFTATRLDGSTLTPGLNVSASNTGSAYYYAATGNVYGPTVNNLLQATSSGNNATAALFSGVHKLTPITVAYVDPNNNNVASLVAKLQIDTGGEPVTSIDVQTAYQMADGGPYQGQLASSYADGFYNDRDGFFTLFNWQNAAEVSGLNTPTSYGVAVNSTSANSSPDFGATKTSTGLSIGSTVMPYYGTMAANSLASPSASYNSNAGYDGVSAADLTVLGAQALAANAGTKISLTVAVSNVAQPATLAGYLDFQGAGVFTGTGDQATVQVPAGATSAKLTWTVPTNAKATMTSSWLRLRLQYGASGATTPLTLAPTGWQDSGETEDWSITLGAPATLLSLSKALASPRVNDTDQFAMQVHTGSVSGPVVPTTETSATTAGTGSDVTSGTGTTGTLLLDAGTTYYLTEAESGTTVLSGYSATITCTDAANVQPSGSLPNDAPLGSGVAITAVSGQRVACVITNTAASTTSVFVDKRGAAPDGSPVGLAGSTWGLFADDGGAPGASVTGVTATPVPGVTGQVRFDDLRPGTYWLEETSAPTGFNLLAEPVKFTVASDLTVTVDPTQVGTVIQVSTDDAGLTHIIVTDLPTLTLPFTGASGAALFTTVGLLLLALAAVGAILFARRPSRAREPRAVV